jgi:hypothetical protein
MAARVILHRQVCLPPTPAKHASLATRNTNIHLYRQVFKPARSGCLIRPFNRGVTHVMVNTRGAESPRPLLRVVLLRATVPLVLHQRRKRTTKQTEVRLPNTFSGEDHLYCYEKARLSYTGSWVAGKAGTNQIDQKADGLGPQRERDSRSDPQASLRSGMSR